jgi:hypothetical protein
MDRIKNFNEIKYLKVLTYDQLLDGQKPAFLKVLYKSKVRTSGAFLYLLTRNS